MQYKSDKNKRLRVVSLILLIFLSISATSCSIGSSSNNKTLFSTGILKGMLFPLPDNPVFSQTIPELKQYRYESIMSKPDDPDYEEVGFGEYFSSSDDKLFAIQEIYIKGEDPESIVAYLFTFRIKVDPMSKEEIQNWNSQYVYKKENNYKLIFEKSTLITFNGGKITGFAVDDEEKKFILATYDDLNQRKLKIVVLDKNDKVIDEWFNMPNCNSEYPPTLYQSHRNLFVLYPEKRVYVKPIENDASWKSLISGSCLSLAFCNDYLVCLTRKGINIYNFDSSKTSISLIKRITIPKVKIDRPLRVEGWADEETNQILFRGEGPNKPNTPIKYYTYIYNLDANYLVELEDYGSCLFEYLSPQRGKKQIWFCNTGYGTVELVYSFYRLKSLKSSSCDPKI